MQYTTGDANRESSIRLFYQDFKDTFVCNTQLSITTHNATLVVLSGFQRYFCMQYTTLDRDCTCTCTLFYQDFKDTFVCNTQQTDCLTKH